LFLISGNVDAQNTKAVSTADITKSVFEKGLQHTDIDFYAGTLMMHAVSEFALLKGNDQLLKRVVGLYEKFGTGEIKAKGNFISYEAGGSGAAYLAYKNATNKLDEQVSAAADKMMKKQKRSPEGLMTAMSANNELHQVFIDMAFAVTPYLLYSGLKLNNQEYINFAALETLGLFKILKDEKTGLLHQARGYNGLGNLTEDNWSRGNGWGAFALAILVRDLPANHPKRAEVEALAKQFFTAVVKHQNKEGLWNQEMTDPTSYVETSGSGLLLYGEGIMLEKGLIDKKYMQQFRRGLQSFTSYIGSDGSVSHSCFSCLCPGKGTKEDYRIHPWVYNDPHAFGPVVLAFAQAAKMGITTITPSKKLGYYSIVDSPKVPRTYATYARGTDVSWENDRIGFRVYGGPSVRNKVRSGIDIWAKSVDYPVLDKWYKLNEQGKDYHVDRGEGHDFYHMGKQLGCGALAIWIDGKPYASETFDSYKIRQNQNDKVGVELEYKTWNVPDMKITELKRIEMEQGTNLFKVTSTLKSEQDIELTVAIGLTTYGKQQVYHNKERGALSVWETIDTTNGSLGTAVLVNPENFAGFASYKGDEYSLIKVKTNVPFSYYAGAGWDKSKYYRNKEDWNKYINDEAEKVKF
jgi:rhamnogalacturonyl hydrolase YesR